MASATVRIGARHIARRGALLGGSGSAARAAARHAPMLASENVQGAASASAWRDSVRRPFTARSFASSADDKKEADEKAAAGEGAVEGGVTVEELQAQLAEKDVLLAEKDAEVADMKDKSLRVLADMENLRERTARQAESSQKFAIQGFAKDLLDFVDNLERATGSLPDDFASKSGEEATKLLTSYHQGILMTQRQILSLMGRHGVERYFPEGEEFDPNWHQSLFEVPDPTKEAGTIAAVTKAGYSLHGRCLRPADVGVVRAA